MKIVINRCHGGFGLSDEAIKRYKELSDNEDYPHYFFYLIKRNDPALVKVVEELGKKASGEFAKLAIVDTGRYEGKFEIHDEGHGMERASTPVKYFDKINNFPE